MSKAAKALLKAKALRAAAKTPIVPQNMECTFIKDGIPVGGVTKEGELILSVYNEEEEEDKENA